MREGSVLRFDSFKASIGPKELAIFRRRNCQFALKVAVPSGWQYSVPTLGINGSVFLQTETQNVTQRNVVTFTDSRKNMTAEVKYAGVVNQNFTNEIVFPPSNLIWSNYTKNESLFTGSIYSSLSGENTTYASFEITSVNANIDWRQCDIEQQ